MIEIKHRLTSHTILTIPDDSLVGADLVGADLVGADLRYANLRDANLRNADLRGADLRYADLRNANLEGASLDGADLRNANLGGASLDGAILPGFPEQEITSLAHAAERTREWLAGGHWVQEEWITTPTGAYAGDCRACLHGAARYVGGPTFGPQLSDLLDRLGYTVGWNDVAHRTLPEVLAACEHAAREAAASP